MNSTRKFTVETESTDVRTKNWINFKFSASDARSFVSRPSLVACYLVTQNDDLDHDTSAIGESGGTAEENGKAGVV